MLKGANVPELDQAFLLADTALPDDPSLLILRHRAHHVWVLGLTVSQSLRVATERLGISLNVSERAFPLQEKPPPRTLIIAPLEDLNDIQSQLMKASVYCVRVDSGTL